MSPVPLAAFLQIALSCSTPSDLPAGNLAERVAATAQAESGLYPTALHDNTTGQSFVPESAAEAIALASTLHAQGHSLDAGLMQLNDANWSRLGLTAETVFDPRRNVCAGVIILAEAYAIERRVSCRYNTGRPDCSNGYPERIDNALRHVRAESAITSPQANATNEPPAAPIPADPFIGHGPVREMMFAPGFNSVALPQPGARPAVPAVPDTSTAAPDRGRGFATIRSVSR